MSIETQIALSVITVAGLAGLVCALAGQWLVLRQESMLGDGISHAVLPGLAIAFLVTGTRDLGPMMIGATLAALVMVGLTSALRYTVRLDGGAALGISFSVLFALGVVLVTRSARQVDLDPGCVLFGLVELVSLEMVRWRGLEIPRAAIGLGTALVLVILFRLVAERLLAFSTFDPSFAQQVGLRPRAVGTALSFLAALAVVVSFEAVGSILVVAMLVAPASTAQLLARRLPTATLVTALCPLIAAPMGYALASLLDTSVAGMMAVSLGLIYALSLAARGAKKRRLASP